MKKAITINGMVILVVTIMFTIVMWTDWAFSEGRKDAEKYIASAEVLTRTTNTIEMDAALTQMETILLKHRKYPAWLQEMKSTREDIEYLSRLDERVMEETKYFQDITSSKLYVVNAVEVIFTLP